MTTAPRDPRPKQRPWMHVSFVPVNIALAALTLPLSGLNRDLLVQWTAWLGAISLILTLVPPNVLHLERFRRGGLVKTLAGYRAPLGISAGVWFVAHALISLRLFDRGAPLLAQFFAQDTVLALLALLVFVALLVTSTTAWQRRLAQNWKVLQRLVWFSLPLAIVHAFLSSTRFFGPDESESFGAFLLILPVAFVAYELFSLGRAGTGRRKANTHLRLVLAGAATATALFFALPTGPSPVATGEQGRVLSATAAQSTSTLHSPEWTSDDTLTS